MFKDTVVEQTLLRRDTVHIGLLSSLGKKVLIKCVTTRYDSITFHKVHLNYKYAVGPVAVGAPLFYAFLVRISRCKIILQGAWSIHPDCAVWCEIYQEALKNRSKKEVPSESEDNDGQVSSEKSEKSVKEGEKDSTEETEVYFKKKFEKF